MKRSGESGIALVVAMFMVLVLSVLGASLIFVSRTETLSSLNYKNMSQTRYGAESAVHGAANYLLWTYATPGVADLGVYNMAASPVTYGGNSVTLSSRDNEASNYPVEAVRNAFYGASRGMLNVANSSIAYDAQATLLSMRSFIDSMTGLPTTIQTWQIVGRGRVEGAGSAQVEVAAILERQDVPLYKYAAFATADGCDAISFKGGATTDSYDSTSALVSGAPVLAQHTGNVGSNGNLAEVGNPTTVYGSLSTPRSGVGACSAGNVTAVSFNGGSSVEGGIIELPQAVNYPTPPAINPAPPVSSMSFGSGCPGGVLYCTASAGGATITPPSNTSIVQLGNVDIASHDVLHLNAGIYEVNSINVTSHGQLVVDSGPVIIRVAGAGTSVPIDLTGGGVVNATFDAADLQFIYGGTDEVRLRGGAQFSAVVYAPNSSTSFAGNGDFYGALVTKQLTNTGGAAIHYDRNLSRDGFTLGNPVLNSFTWRSY